MNFDYICTPKSARRVNSWVLCVCTGDDMWQAACSILAQKGTLKFQYISKHWPILFARARMSMIANGRHRCGFCCASGFGPLNTCFVRWPTGRMCLRISFSRTRRKASTMPSPPPHLSSLSGLVVYWEHTTAKYVLMLFTHCAMPPTLPKHTCRTHPQRPENPKARYNSMHTHLIHLRNARVTNTRCHLPHKSLHMMFI